MRERAVIDRFVRSRSLFDLGSELNQGAIALFGVRYDSTASFRPGARFGPPALREASDGLETYCPSLDRDIEDLRVADLGDLDVHLGSPEPVIKMVREAVGGLLDMGVFPLMIGGEHSLTAGAVEAARERHESLVVVQLDAHADLRSEYLGEPYSHASAMRRCLDVLRPDGLLQVGIRSGTREEFTEMKAARRWIPARPDALAEALKPFPGCPLYLTVDLDLFDPSVLPGTGTPEPGGIDWETFSALLRVLPAHQIVAADVMELAPVLDPSGVSAVVAAKVVRQLLLLCGQ